MSEKENEGKKKAIGFGSLLDGPKKDGAKPKRAKKPPKKKALALMVDPEVKQKFDEIQWLRETKIDYRRLNRNEMLKGMVEAYAEKIGYDRLMEKYRGDMPEDISPSTGRPQGS